MGYRYACMFNRVRSIPMYIGMSNDFYRPTKIASCAPGLSCKARIHIKSPKRLLVKNIYLNVLSTASLQSSTGS